MKYVIDRIENDIVVLENQESNQEGIMEEKPLSIFPQNAKEGDVVEISSDFVQILEKETRDRKEEMERLFDSLRK